MITKFDAASEECRRVLVSEARLHMGQTDVRLFLGGRASTDPDKVKMPHILPFWILAAMALLGMFVIAILRVVLWRS